MRNEHKKQQLLTFGLPCICALLHWCVIHALHLPRYFFRNQERTSIYWIPKFFLLLLLLVFWNFLFRFARQLRAGNARCRRGLQIFGVYFTILTVLMLILWPGTFSWDDAITLNVISYYKNFFPLQHFLTGLYQDVLLHLLPTPGGMILLQNFIIALCVSFCVTRLEETLRLRRLKNPLADILLKLLPFFAPPVLMYQFSGYRIGLYVFLEVLMLVMLLCASRSDSPQSWGELLLFCFVSVVVTVWRTESLIYVPFLLALLCFIGKDVLPPPKKLCCATLILCGFFLLTQLQNSSMGSDSSYQLISLCRPATVLARSADPIADAQELAALDQVVNLEVIRDNPDQNGEQLYWSDTLVREYTPEAYSAFQKALVGLALKHPLPLIAERWDLFVQGSGITGDSAINLDSAVFFDDDFHDNAKEVTVSKDWVAFYPVFPQLRRALIRLMWGFDLQGNPTPTMPVLTNAIVPELILLAVWFGLLYRKKWYPWLMCTAVLGRLAIVFLAEPSYWLMYVLSFYLLGYLCLIYLIWIRFGSEKGTAQ